MRIGVNPEKKKETQLVHKRHRIIMPFWIPNIEDDYFRNQPEVLRICLQSLIDTIDASQTNITLINNNSCSEASEVAEAFVAKGVIDKYVVRNENRGKLENVLAEARASYEDYITVSDADFLFFDGWEKAISNIMNAFPQAGMVSCYPAAHLAYFYNSNIIWHSPKEGKIISDDDINLFEKGHGHTVETGLYSRNGLKRKKCWCEAHYFFRRNNVIAIAGAVHALATFRRNAVQNFDTRKVQFVFKNGYEEEYIDQTIQKSGYLRLSTPQLFAYHLGNTVPDDVVRHYMERKRQYGNNVSNSMLWKQESKNRVNAFYRTVFPATVILFRALRKFRII